MHTSNLIIFINELKLRNIKFSLRSKNNILYVNNLTPDYIIENFILNNIIDKINIFDKNITMTKFDYTFQDDTLIITYKNGKLNVIPF